MHYLQNILDLLKFGRKLRSFEIFLSFNDLIQDLFHSSCIKNSSLISYFSPLVLIEVQSQEILVFKRGTENKMLKRKADSRTL